MKFITSYLDRSDKIWYIYIYVYMYIYIYNYAYVYICSFSSFIFKKKHTLNPRTCSERRLGRLNRPVAGPKNAAQFKSHPGFALDAFLYISASLPTPPPPKKKKKRHVTCPNKHDSVFLGEMMCHPCNGGMCSIFSFWLEDSLNFPLALENKTWTTLSHACILGNSDTPKLPSGKLT